MKKDKQTKLIEELLSTVKSQSEFDALFDSMKKSLGLAICMTLSSILYFGCDCQNVDCFPYAKLEVQVFSNGENVLQDSLIHWFQQNSLSLTNIENGPDAWLNPNQENNSLIIEMANNDLHVLKIPGLEPIELWSIPHL